MNTLSFSNLIRHVETLTPDPSIRWDALKSAIFAAHDRDMRNRDAWTEQEQRFAKLAASGQPDPFAGTTR